MKKLLLLLMFLTLSIPSFAQTYTVERVIDADTIVVTTPGGTSEKVHLIGIGTPESYANANAKAKKDGERTGQDVDDIMAMSQEATEFLKSILIFPDKIRLEYDTQAKDKYGRTLVYVYMGWKLGISVSFAPEIVTKDQEMWMFVNATLVKNGYATPMTIPPNVKYAELFEELYQEAKKNKRGCWNIQEGDSCLEDQECKMMDCEEAIVKDQDCDFNKPVCWNKECTCQFICI